MKLLKKQWLLILYAMSFSGLLFAMGEHITMSPEHSNIDTTPVDHEEGPGDHHEEGPVDHRGTPIDQIPPHETPPTGGGDLPVAHPGGGGDTGGTVVDNTNLHTTIAGQAGGGELPHDTSGNGNPATTVLNQLGNGGSLLGGDGSSTTGQNVNVEVTPEEIETQRELLEGNVNTAKNSVKFLEDELKKLTKGTPEYNDLDIKLEHAKFVRGEFLRKLEFFNFDHPPAPEPVTPVEPTPVEPAPAPTHEPVVVAPVVTHEPITIPVTERPTGPVEIPVSGRGDHTSGPTHQTPRPDDYGLLGVDGGEGNENDQGYTGNLTIEISPEAKILFKSDWNNILKLKTKQAALERANDARISKLQTQRGRLEKELTDLNTQRENARSLFTRAELIEAKNKIFADIQKLNKRNAIINEKIEQITQQIDKQGIEYALKDTELDRAITKQTAALNNKVARHNIDVELKKMSDNGQLGILSRQVHLLGDYQRDSKKNALEIPVLEEMIQARKVSLVGDFEDKIKKSLFSSKGPFMENAAKSDPSMEKLLSDMEQSAQKAETESEMKDIFENYEKEMQLQFNHIVQDKVPDLITSFETEAKEQKGNTEVDRLKNVLSTYKSRSWSLSNRADLSFEISVLQKVISHKELLLQIDALIKKAGVEDIVNVNPQIEKFQQDIKNTFVEDIFSKNNRAQNYFESIKKRIQELAAIKKTINTNLKNSKDKDVLSNYDKQIKDLKQSRIVHLGGEISRQDPQNAEIDLKIAVLREMIQARKQSMIKDFDKMIDGIFSRRGPAMKDTADNDSDMQELFSDMKQLVQKATTDYRMDNIFKLYRARMNQRFNEISQVKVENLIKEFERKANDKNSKTQLNQLKNLLSTYRSQSNRADLAFEISVLQKVIMHKEFQIKVDALVAKETNPIVKGVFEKDIPFGIHLGNITKLSLHDVLYETEKSYSDQLTKDANFIKQRLQFINKTVEGVNLQLKIALSENATPAAKLDYIQKFLDLEKTLSEAERKEQDFVLQRLIYEELKKQLQKEQPALTPEPAPQTETPKLTLQPKQGLDLPNRVTSLTPNPPSRSRGKRGNFSSRKPTTITEEPTEEPNPMPRNDAEPVNLSSEDIKWQKEYELEVKSYEKAIQDAQTELERIKTLYPQAARRSNNPNSLGYSKLQQAFSQVQLLEGDLEAYKKNYISQSKVRQQIIRNDQAIKEDQKESEKPSFFQRWLRGKK